MQHLSQTYYQAWRIPQTSFAVAEDRRTTVCFLIAINMLQPFCGWEFSADSRSSAIHHDFAIW